MPLKMGRVFVVTFLIALVLTPHEARAATPGQQSHAGQVECPPRILDTARAAIVSKVGEEFFTKYLAQNGCRYYPREESPPAAWPSKGRQLILIPSVGPKRPFWSVEYRLRVPSKPWVDGPVSVEVDSTGSVVGRIDGICDCVQRPSACDFSVNESTAVEAAKRAGFDPGLRPWKVQFQWVAIIPVPCYEWVISNTLHLQTDGCSGDGEALIIDASTAEVLTKSSHGWICDFANNPERFPSDSEFVYYEDRPVPVTTVKPIYTDHARDARITGDVILHVLVGKDGQVKSTKVVRGVTELNYMAVDAVRQWVFKPALSNNKPVAVWIEIPFHFPP